MWFQLSEGISILGGGLSALQFLRSKSPRPNTALGFRQRFVGAASRLVSDENSTFLPCKPVLGSRSGFRLWSHLGNGAWVSPGSGSKLALATSDNTDSVLKPSLSFRW